MYKRIMIPLLLAIVLSSCLKPTFYRRMNKAAIPADIKNARYVLLVSSYNDRSLDNGNNKQVEEALEENYPGKYEVIYADQEKDPKYSDKSVYRYFLTWSGYYSMTKTVKTGQVVNSHSSAVIYITDRSTGKTGSLEEGLPHYVKALKYFGQYVKDKM